MPNSDLFDLCETIRDAGTAALVPFGFPFEPFVSHSVPSVDSGSILAVYLASFGPAGTARADRWPGGLPPRAEVVVELWESCYPAVEGIDEPSLPCPDELQVVNEGLYEHGCALYYGLKTMPVLPSLDSVLVGVMVPLGPQGLMAGWRITLQVTY